jgi:hypothetical protein
VRSLTRGDRGFLLACHESDVAEKFKVAGT